MHPSYIVVAGLVCMAATTHSYKPIVFMHGIFAAGSEFDYFTTLIEKFHPGTPTTEIKMYENMHSITNLWEQVEKISEKMGPILTNKSSEGTILICYSQGGPVCRGLLSVMEHNVDTLITLSSPLAGQFGDTDYMKYLFPTYLRDNVYRVLYTHEGQEISVGNYWYDPHHYDLYQKYSNYLAVLNNESSSGVHNRSQEFKNNFLRLKHVVLVGGPDDEVITPWQSSHFGMYNASEAVLPMEEQKWYQNDAFGLRTLDKKGLVKMHTVPGMKHSDWHMKAAIFNCCIKPYLS